MSRSVASLFTAHPATVGETYLQHLHSAAKFSALMFCGAAACLIHAVLPFAFVRTGVLPRHDAAHVEGVQPLPGDVPQAVAAIEGAHR